MRPHASLSSQYTARSFDEDESAAGPSGGVAPAGAAQDQRHRPAQPMLLLHQAVAIMAAASQVAITVSQWSRATSSTGQALTGLLAIGLVCAAVGTVRWPHTYWRNRHWLMPSVRILLYSVPTMRQMGVGAALMLEHPATPGWRGAAKDFLRLLSGTRLLGVAVGGAAVLTSPLTTLATQALLVLFTSNTPGYCATQLLRAPLSQLRLAQLAALFELAALPMLMAVPTAERLPLGSTLVEELPTGQAPPELVCLAALPFLSMSLGVLLPTALAAYCWRSPAADAEHETGRGASADSFAGATPQLSGAAAGSGRKAGSALRGAAAAAAGAANRMLRTVFCSEKGTQSRALACWWFSALFWWLCSRLGGRLY